MRKFVFSIFLSAMFAINAIATKPGKLPAIVIDTLYEAKGSLVIEYEVIRSFDQISLNVQSSRSMALRDDNPVLLSGNTGKGKTSVPVTQDR